MRFTDISRGQNMGLLKSYSCFARLTHWRCSNLEMH